MEVEFVNIKKLFPEKKISGKGVMDFFDRKGFYIVLILCIAIVGATAVFVTTHNITSSNSDLNSQKLIPDENTKIAEAGSAGKESAQSQSAAALPGITSGAKSSPDNSKAADKAVSSNSTNKQADNQSVNKGIAAVGKTTEPKKSEPVKMQKFIAPVFGENIFDYSQDKLVYSKTLEEWRTHSGVDISADRGTPVKAAADGVVSEVKTDPRLGVTIIIDHKNGIKTVYANLAEDDMVSPNQKVKQGDVIGSVGNSAAFEAVEQSHIHFEVLKGDEPVNPSAYLPQK
jgi:murein DD-endopeptidase MepM/ murein hydrolase activator NlpD